ncbi:MAG: DNA-binding protein [Candidatus Diapherotrites archaeon]|nr:DNA-binding protein [Candidatus Diapherotrites archaeon]
MKVKDLQVRKSVDSIELEIVSIDEPRTWSNPRGSGRVASATAKDDTGEVKLTLWNDDIDKVKKGDTIVIENGWVGEFQGEKQLSTGRYGKLTVNPK